MKRKFGFSFDDLYHRCVLLVELLTRDLAEFVKFGYPETIADNLIALIAKFKKVELDLVRLSSQKKSSLTKNDTATSIKTLLYAMQVKADSAYHKGLVEVPLIELGSISTLTLDELRYEAESYLQVLQNDFDTAELLDVLSTELAGLETLLEDYTQAIKNQGASKIRRKISTQKRVILANELFEEYSKLSAIGKKIWQLSDPAKADNYVIYPTVHSSVEEEPDDGGGEPTDTTADEVEISNA